MVYFKSLNDSLFIVEWDRRIKGFPVRVVRPPVTIFGLWTLGSWAESGEWFEARRDSGTRIILHLRPNDLTLLYLFRRVRLWNQTVNQKIEDSFHLASGKTKLNKTVFITTRITKYLSTCMELVISRLENRQSAWFNQLWEQWKDGGLSTVEKQMFWKQVAEKKKPLGSPWPKGSFIKAKRKCNKNCKRWNTSSIFVTMFGWFLWLLFNSIFRLQCQHIFISVFLSTLSHV